MKNVSTTQRRWPLLQTVVMCCILFFSGSAFGQTVFTFRAPEGAMDKRYEYDTALLRLALEKTQGEFGEFELRPSPSMNFKRAMEYVKNNTLPNFFIKQSYEAVYETQMDLAYVKFPVDLGIVGFRVCFVCPDKKEQVSRVETLADLKQFTHAQGAGWADTKILRHNGFQVEEVGTYDPLFTMVSICRFDLFCRGTNELLAEYDAYKTRNPDLTYDTAISIAYPLPRFFYTHRTNQKAIERVTKGLHAAYQDGSLKELWQKQYKDSIDFVNLEKRKIFWIENPLVKDIDFDYRQYFYDPMKK